MGGKKGLLQFPLFFLLLGNKICLKKTHNNVKLILNVILNNVYSGSSSWWSSQRGSP